MQNFEKTLAVIIGVFTGRVSLFIGGKSAEGGKEPSVPGSGSFTDVLHPG
jgi:hypothetical protein